MSLLNSKSFFCLLLALPFLWIGYGISAGEIFYGQAIHLTGDISAWLMMLALAVTPCRLFFANASWPNWLLQRRRYIGVASCAYAALHTGVYLNRKADIDLIVAEAADFAMWTGWLAMAIFIVLTVTSNDASVRRLQRGWKKLHRWTYPAALLVFLHWIFAAFDPVPGTLHLAAILFLESYRIWKKRQLKRQAIT